MSLLLSVTENSLLIMSFFFRSCKNSCCNLVRMFELASLSVIFDLNHVKAAFAVDSISIAALYVENADAFMSIFEIFPCKSTERMCNNEKLSVTKLFLLVIASIVRLITRFWAIFSQAPISTYSFKSFESNAYTI